MSDRESLFAERNVRLPCLFGFLGLTGVLGTLGICLLIAAIVGGVWFIVEGSFKSSPVVTEALAAAQADPDVVRTLGSPIQIGWFISGSISEQGISGDADLVIPISGPRKGGTLYASARKGNGVWHFYTLAVQVDGDNEIIQLDR